MANQPPTIGDSFAQRLPDLNLRPVEYIASHPVSTTAARVDGPKAWIEHPSAQYVDRATRLLNAFRNSPALHTRTPAIERPFVMKTEADVIRAGTLYVLHSVNQAVNAQFTVPTICCATEDINHALRCDLVWKYRDGMEWKVLAIMEMKNRGMMAKDDFYAGLVTQANCAAMIARAAGDTLLDVDANNLSQQAAAYACRWDTPYVALFDWNSLFLYCFSNLRAREGTIGDWAYGTWVQEQQGTTFRKALLGFLVSACKAKGLIA